MSHGWRGWVGVAVIGAVGCVGPDKGKLPPKLGMPATLPPPSNILGAGVMPATPPGGSPASTTSSTSPTKTPPITTASRTPATTPAPTTIPGATPAPAATNLAEAHERMNMLTGRPGDATPVVPSPTPGITYATAPRPIQPPPVPVPSDPPPTLKASGPPLGLSNVLPNEQPIAASLSQPPFPKPALPAASETIPSIDGPVMPTTPLTLDHP